MVNFSSRNSLAMKAYAKVNLGLDVAGIREDGYHNLDTIACLIDLYNIVRVSVSPKPECAYSFTYSAALEKIYGEKSAKPQKSALWLAEKIREAYNLPAVDIAINADIPLGAGLGGSAVDAAATAYLMSKLFGLEGIENELLLSAGADVPFFYHSYMQGGVKRIYGIGNVEETLPYRQLYIAPVYTLPRADTAAVFGYYDTLPQTRRVDMQGIAEYFWGHRQFDGMRLANALEESAVALTPGIARAKQCLIDAGFSQTVLTGSGSCYIGVEENAAVFEKKYTNLKKLIGNDNVFAGAYKTIENINQMR
jgi:4-diphosphocytidyl-2-C-methyl-D-erythritol kinase